MRFKCILFDLDGTLVDTIGDIAASMNHALEEGGFPALTRESYAKIVGNGLRNLAAKALPPSACDEKTVDTVYRSAIAYYTDHPADLSRPYPGIPELAAELRGRSDRRSAIKTAVLSNKADSITQLVIGKLFPRYTFDMVLGERPGVPRKPDPTAAWELITELDSSPRETLFVGDSEVDVATALAAECSFLGVSWGFRGRAILEAAGADRIIDDPAELWELLALRY
ncbi:HAD family hydrolase [Treponema primitia]|uniref:HAD family hydrolase n=1 Tax=Treponema primitia TaxID=88058 RepID=UPI000255541B|nr:HAD family hydrolase [Treponema primitia]